MENLTLNSIREKRELTAFLDEVKKEMVLNSIYYKKAKFSCFSDSIFTYSYSNHTTMFEFNIICEDTLLDKMTIKGLLELRRIKYFESSVYDKETMEKLGGAYYTSYLEDDTE